MFYGNALSSQLRLFTSPLSPITYSTKCLKDCFFYFGNSIIRASVEKGYPYKALGDYKKLLLYPTFQPDCRTITLILKACKNFLNISVAVQTHARIIKTGFHSSVSLASSMFKLYLDHDFLSEARRLFNEMLAKESNPVYGNFMIMGLVRDGDVDMAVQLFSEMPVKDLVSWNSIIGSCASTRPMQAIDLFRKMLRSGLEPDGFSCSSILSACGQLGALGLGEHVHQIMLDKGIVFNQILSSAVVDMYAKCGRIDLAKKTFDSVCRDNVSVWNSMITGLAIHGLGNEVPNLLSRMEAEGVMPDGVTFVGILTACSHSGMLLEGRHYFDIMKTLYSIEPRIEHFGAMVDMLGRAGLLEEANEMIKRMTMEPDSVIWRVLLNGCWKYKRPDMAELVIEQISRRECGDYVLLSSSYSSVRRWGCAETIWDLMRKRNIRKARGLSWVEKGSRLYRFKAGDRSHKESEGIYMVLETLMRRARAEGYAPVTDLVKMDVLEEEKEVNLAYHSEKLAVAYCILMTNPQTEVRIMKNLRTCEDCHIWVKIVSKVLSRVIILRDRIRFHRFENGTCTCGDYW